MIADQSCRNFTYNHYADIIRYAISKNYTISPLRDYEKNIGKNRVIFLRHDVDLDVDLAVKMAEKEYELGVKSTYFFRLHAKYNLFNFYGYKALLEIKAMGHEIGLHHEGVAPDLFSIESEKLIKYGKEIIEMLIKEKVKGISLHEPARTGLKLNNEMLKRLGFEYDAYNEKFINDIKYISDSSANWREGCLCNFIIKEIPRLCVLVHPFWWYERTSLENY